ILHNLVKQHKTIGGMNSFIIVSAILGMVGCAPQFGPPVAILRQESSPIFNGNWRSEFEAENGIIQSMVGELDNSGFQVMRGSYSYPLDDGSIAAFNWIADSNGYRVESPLLPIAPVNPHPIP
ncbi:unnamed protein product, partial [Meganyctiphanes norvegica]